MTINIYRLDITTKKEHPVKGVLVTVINFINASFH
jgi:hypothetical protein